ncbi:hypothetical protein HY384_04245 [Candidatus Daviesbacteria bacterium]|nr:hypothetical protein [Candidatus Daviesbacteria bacterium]
MANRRMLHKSISINLQVNSLSEFAQLIFTWTIPHLDDFGKIEGETEVIKALVKPMSGRSIDDFEAALNEIVQAGLIERYIVDGKKIICFPTFDKHQTGLTRRTESRYPDNPAKHSENFNENQISSPLTEQNLTEDKLRESNQKRSKEEVKRSERNTDSGRDKDVNPVSFFPSNDGEELALTTWREFAPDNPELFGSLFLKALRQGLSVLDYRKIATDSARTSDPISSFIKKVDEFLNLPF